MKNTEKLWREATGTVLSYSWFGAWTFFDRLWTTDGFFFLSGMIKILRAAATTHSTTALVTHTGQPMAGAILSPLAVTE
jgi:hypothetical protein